MSRRIFTAMILIALVMGAVPAMAAPSEAAALAVTVDATWSVSEQLTTIDSGNDGIWDEGSLPGPTDDDDIRYVKANLNVTTTAEFWAAEVTCTVNPAVLDAYQENADTFGFNDYHDDEPMIQPGSVWYDNDWEWYRIEQFGQVVPGQLKMIFTKRGQAPAVGRNGESMTGPLVSIRYRVGQAAGTSPLNCSFNFLDRDGRAVVPRVKYNAPDPLNVITGYTVAGTASLQVHSVAAHPIRVVCENMFLQNGFQETVTDKYGKFVLGDLRVRQDWLKCNFSPSGAGTVSDLYLTSELGFDMNQHGSYFMLPVELKGGNLDLKDCGDGNECIDDDDIAIVTANWGQNAQGDANSDGLTNEADLAIVASNYGLGETVGAWHLIYSLARLWDNAGRHSQIWLGDEMSAAVTAQVQAKKNTTDLWATLSPDGRTLAFVRKDDRRGNYELYTSSTVDGKGKAVRLLAKNKIGNLDAFAPSWSQDGLQISFICSNSYGHVEQTNWGIDRWEYSGYGMNSGDLCVVNADGTGFRRLTTENQAKIWPPVWEGTWLIFGGTTHPGDCANSLCVFDLSSNNNYPWRLDNDVPGGTYRDNTGSYQEVADMPVMVNGWLFYRYTYDMNSDPDNWEESNELRVIMDGFDYGSCGSMGCDYVHSYTSHPGVRPGDTGNDDLTPRPQYLHTAVMTNQVEDYQNDPPNYVPVDVDFNDAPPYRLDYYEMAPYGFSFIFEYTRWGGQYYRSDFNWNTQDTDPLTGPCADGAGTDTDQCFPEWSPNTFYNNRSWHLDGQTGNWYSDATPLQPWNSDSLLWAERQTVDWVP